jgi:hypothetical protein
METMIVMIMILRRAINGTQLTYPEKAAEPVVCTRKSSVFSLGASKYIVRKRPVIGSEVEVDPARSIIFVFMMVKAGLV